MNDYQAQKSARASAAAALQAAFPQLTPVAGKVDGLQAAAKNIRSELKAAFPGIKFSVKSERYSMGDSIHVRWTDGPNSDQVKEITGKYQAGSFNGMEDIYEYSRSAWTDAFGDAKYVHSNRENSERAIESALRTLKSKNFVDLEGIDLSLDAWKAGALRNVRVWNDWLPGVVHQIAAKRTWCLTKKAAAAAEEVAA